MNQTDLLLYPIRSEADYKRALQRAEAFFEALITLVEAYERKHHPVDPPDPVDAIKFRMEQAGLSVKDMESMIGQSNRVYEVLGRKRPLTLRMIRRLHKELGIPAEVLIAGGRRAVRVGRLSRSLSHHGIV